jgi:hypothetical protein
MGTTPFFRGDHYVERVGIAESDEQAKRKKVIIDSRNRQGFNERTEYQPATYRTIAANCGILHQ